MRPIDAALLAGRPRRAVFLPTAAALDGEETVDYWIELGTRHYAALDVEPVPLRVVNREDAERHDYAAQIAGAGLIYLSGGNPGYLADTLRDTAVWRAIVAAFDSGTALAGCSAGACALSAIARDFRNPGRYAGRGLGIVPELAVIPHFDRFVTFAPDLVGDLLALIDENTTLVGIDEDTAILRGPDHWVVEGRQTATVIGRDGARSRFTAGETLDLTTHAPAD
jgi:cyanophycinase-like exopeptidase